jgi:hypothetical protein
MSGSVVQRLGHSHDTLEEEVAALRVDRLVEGVWNSYFGTEDVEAEGMDVNVISFSLFGWLVADGWC